MPMGPNPYNCSRCTQLGGCIACLIDEASAPQMIDYQVLQDSLIFYCSKGFQRIESPWTVTKAVSDITRPPTAPEWAIEGKNKVLVASGEQSYLYLYLKGFLPQGRFVTITPCFRDEPFDLTHTKYFMKTELIDTEEVSQRHLDDMINAAYQFFADQIGSKTNLNLNRYPDGSCDIEWHGHELGSYGIRTCPFLDWVYGTGVAEPRFSTLRKYYNGLSHKGNS